MTYQVTADAVDLWQFNAFIAPRSARVTYRDSHGYAVGRRLRHYAAGVFATIRSQSASVIFHKPRSLVGRPGERSARRTAAGSRTGVAVWRARAAAGRSRASRNAADWLESH